MNAGPPGARRGHRPGEVPLALALVVILTGAAYLTIRTVPVGFPDRALTLASFTLLLLPFLLFSTGSFRERIHGGSWKIRIAYPWWIFLAYLVFLLGPGAPRPASGLLLLLYLGLPILFSFLPGRAEDRPDGWDAAAIALLYLPVELSLLAPAWEPASEQIPSPAHLFSVLTGINLTLFYYLSLRGMSRIGYTFRLRGADLAPGVIAFGLFFPLAVFLGAATGFVPFDPHLPDPARIPGMVLAVAFFVALPEEIFFRGILQNQLERISPTPAGRRTALWVASILFGLSHLNNHPLFDWRYVTIATLAGIAYGTVYARTGKVTASAVTHTLVDVVWRLCF